MNLAWASGVADAIDVSLQPVLAARDGVCCVEFQRRETGSPIDASS
jgi:hypothetical protein